VKAYPIFIVKLLIHFTPQKGVYPNNKKESGYHVAYEAEFIDAVVKLHVLRVLGKQRNL
jgi:hypothetical protein